MLRPLTTLLILAAAPAYAEPPAATVAVAFDRTSVRPVIAEGLADKATGRKATADSPVRVASVSKLIVALGAMRLVDAGALDLDRDVSDYLGWRLRNPAFPEAPITLRLLLSHQSSLVDGGELYIVPLGETVRERLADPRVWDAAHGPDSGWFHYANLNFPVIASAMEAATGERFDALMTRLVFRPLKLDACLNWSGCSAQAVRRAVVLYGADGALLRDDLHGAPPPCSVVAAADGSCDLSRYRPGENGALFSPQGGVRISMRDLARFGRMLANRGGGFLTAAAFAELTAPQWRLSGANGLDEEGQAGGIFCAYGLAVHIIGTATPSCRDDLFGDRITRTGHSGEAYGLRSGLWLDPKSGRGLAFFTTEVADDAVKGPSGFTQREEAVVWRAQAVRKAAFLTTRTTVWRIAGAPRRVSASRWAAHWEPRSERQDWIVVRQHQHGANDEPAVRPRPPDPRQSPTEPAVGPAEPAGRLRPPQRSAGRTGIRTPGTAEPVR